MLLEICVDTADGLSAAIEGGADRVELCAGLALGGLTPPPSLIALAARAPVPVHAMIRPRDGDFVYSRAEIDQMARDIAAVRDAGLAGLVLGASRTDGALATDVLGEMLAKRGPLQATLHRAFDLTPEPFLALEQALSLGFDRILTSGQATTATGGATLIRDLCRVSSGRIIIMAGAGITADTVGALVRRTGVREVHASATRPGRAHAPSVVALGFAIEEGGRETDVKAVGALKAALAAI